MVDSSDIQEIEVLKRKLEREKAARKAAEQLLEERALEIYNANLELKNLNSRLKKENLEYIKEIEKQNQFFESVFNTLPAQLAVLDANGRYIFMNSRTIKDVELREKCIGLTNEEIAEIVDMPKDVLQQRVDIMKSQLKDPETVDWTEKWEVDGRTKYILRRLHPHFGADGKLRMFIGYGVNVTQNVEDNIKLAKAKESAESATRAKSDFLSKMTHEIRTPLNAITGLTDVMLEDPDNIQEKFIESIKYSADSLLGIINEILDFSKIEAGKMVYESISFNPHKVIEGVRQTFDFRISEKGLHFVIDVDEKVPRHMKGDPQKLAQALINLVGNSVKFTKQGSIAIYARFEGEENNKRLVLKVSDTGVGIPKNKLDTVFQSFEQSSSSTSRHFGGTGLGLTITKRFVEGMGGRISVESEVNKGTTFCIQLPCVQWSMQEQDVKGLVDTIENKDYSDKRILLVEDNLMNQLVFKKMVEKWSPQIEVVNNGEDALVRMKDESWDLVFLDIQMPIKSGIETIEEWRVYESENALPALNVIALTADAFDESRNRALEKGMTDFLTKPLSVEDLGRQLYKYLS